MAFSAPALESILSSILRDIRNLNPEADIGSDSDNYVRSAAVAAAIEGLYQKIAWTYRQIFPDTADEEELVHQAAIRGLPRKDPVSATGPVALKGVAGASLLQGSTLTHVITGEQFNTLSSAILGTDGVATVWVRAATVGTAQNDLVGDLILSSPPLGIDATASFMDATTGGQERETPESLLARLLDIIQQPPAGGTIYDFKRWAKSVDGVADALVIVGRRGGGAVDVVITASDGNPSAEVIANCLAYIQSQCSVIADVWVYAPTIRNVDCAASVELVTGYTLAQVQTAAQTAYNALLGALKPREMLKRSQIEAMINNLAGVADRSVLNPSGNVNASEDLSLVGWIRPGTILLGLML